MKKTLFNTAVMVAMLVPVLLISGCAELHDKFVRKAPEKPKSTSYYAVRQYDVKPNMELYTKRYIFWKTWHTELLSVLMDDNKKKTVTAIEQDISNLIDMQRMLVDEKAEGLGVCIAEMEDIEAQIKRSGVTRGNETRIRRKLETLQKQIKRDYSYRVIDGYIRDEFAPVPSLQEQEQE